MGDTAFGAYDEPIAPAPLLVAPNELTGISSALAAGDLPDTPFPASAVTFTSRTPFRTRPGGGGTDCCCGAPWKVWFA